MLSLLKIDSDTTDLEAAVKWDLWYDSQSLICGNEENTEYSMEDAGGEELIGQT